MKTNKSHLHAKCHHYVRLQAVSDFQLNSPQRYKIHGKSMCRACMIRYKSIILWRTCLSVSQARLFWQDSPPSFIWVCQMRVGQIYDVWGVFKWRRDLPSLQASKLVKLSVVYYKMNYDSETTGAIPHLKLIQKLIRPDSFRVISQHFQDSHQVFPGREIRCKDKWQSVVCSSGQVCQGFVSKWRTEILIICLLSFSTPQ